MTELSCRTVRHWIQAPDALGVIDARHMDRHLATCPDCAAYRRDQVHFDAIIVRALGAAVETSSVRGAVLQRLASGDTLQPRRNPFSRLRSWRMPALVLSPVAVVAAIVVALLGPQTFVKRSPVPAAVAAWHLQRPFFAYPIAIDPRHPDHLLIGAWGQIYQSWNGGQYWRQTGRLPAGLIIRDLTFDATHPGRFLVAAKHSVFVSDDGGARWTRTASSLRGAENMFIAQDPGNPRDMYLGPSVLWKSLDGGLTWHPAGDGHVFAPYGIQSLAFGRGVLYTGIWGGGVAVSHDGGATWRRIMRGLAPNVVSVTTGPGSRLWAATDRGIYFSASSGQTWRRRGPANFFPTSIVDSTGIVLAGGNGSLLRSTDGGRHWVHSQTGLPGDPYVYSLLADPGRSGRVYASINGDGIFRSDDGGRTWVESNAGLPILLQEGRANVVLFLRHGEVWTTTSHGADPGNVTVDTAVRRAVVSSDGASIAYVTGTPGNWSIRTVSAGGSSARTLLMGGGPLPRELLWSPSATALLTITGQNRLTTIDRSGRAASWWLPATAHLVGWTRDGLGIAVWDAASRSLEDRARSSGALLRRWPGTYTGQPLPSGSGQAALVTPAGELAIGSIGGAWRTVGRAPGCVPAAWSDGDARLLLQCAGSAEVVTARGALVGHIAGADAPMWAPDSSGAVLYFRRGKLWTWTPAGSRVLVKRAAPAQ